MLSVIIPTYNCSKYIIESLDSIILQSFQDLEIIIIDDGSTDNTRNIIEEYTNFNTKKIKYRFTNNAGVSAARNKGLKEAKGDYITFLDSDDTLLKESLNKRLALLNNHPEVSLVFSDYNLRNNRDYTIESVLAKRKFLDFFKNNISIKKGNEIIFNDNFYYNYLEFTPLPIWTGTVMIKRSVLEEIGLFREDLKICEDADYWLRIIKKLKVGFINETLSCYNHYQSNLTKQSEEFFSNNLKFYDSLYLDCKETQIKKQLKKKIGICHYNLGYHYRENYNFHNAISHLFKSIIYYPRNIKTYKTFLATLMFHNN